jgi:D-3-phosphoglycerate dehydrogenase
MKVLCITKDEYRNPWYAAIVEAIGPNHVINRYDHGAPLRPQFEGVDVVVQVMAAPHVELMDAAAEAGVKLWQVCSVGLDHTNVAHILEKGLPLTHTPGPYSAVALAEHALFLMLYMAKSFKASQEAILAQSPQPPVNQELGGKTLGIVGLGASGRQLAGYAWPLGMRTMAIDVVEAPQAVRDELHVDFFGDRSHLDRVLAEADYLSLHVPLTSETRHIINRRSFDLMKPTAVLINVARGGLVDEDALIEALQAGRIAGAALDVFAKEPVDPANPLLQMDNVVATPHAAGVTVDTARRRAGAIADNIERLAKGRPLMHQVTAVP